MKTVSRFMFKQINLYTAKNLFITHKLFASNFQYILIILIKLQLHVLTKL